MRTRLIVLFALFCVGLVSAKELKRPESYNFVRGARALSDNNIEEAVTYLNKEIEDNPKNGYAYEWLSAAYASVSEYGKALSNANLALKYIPKRDKEYVAWAYRLRGDAYLAVTDTVKALDDYASAIRFDPANEEYYSLRAEVYYRLGEYDLANKDYEQIVKLNPGGVMGYMGIGRNYNAQKMYDKAVETFSYVISLESEYSSGYSFRAEAYWERGERLKAIKDVVRALEIDDDVKASITMHAIADSALVEMKTHLDVMQKKYPNERRWSLYIANIYQVQKEYAKAIEYYEAANEISYEDYSSFRISECYVEQGRFEDALDAINDAIRVDSAYYEYLDQRAGVYFCMGDIDMAVRDASANIANFPDRAQMYHSRAWIEEFGNEKHIEAAIADYTTAISLQDDISRFYLRRGVCHLRSGNRKAADDDLSRAFGMAVQENDTSTMLFVHAYSNRADSVLQLLPAYKTSDDGSDEYYNIACLYALINQPDSAICYLDKALADSKNITRFHILNDYDMSGLSDSPQLHGLLEKYNLKDYSSEAAHDVVQPEEEGSGAVGVVDEIPFTKRGGVYEVKCSINDLPLSFIFDTGASAVSISSLEANFMMKNGYLSSKDVVGSQRFIDANGDISEGTVINLKSVKFGKSELTNVRASVVHNQKAPLLLGQSVLSRLGTIEIDYRSNKLKISK